jgi:hypothetical protein
MGMTPPPGLTSLAFYLPQFHEIPENDEWWGRGFTEWAQVRPARPYFDWHHVRRPVAPLGYYNLLEPGTMEAQDRLARAHAIDGFAIWDYWFGEGRRLLDQPVRMIHAERLDVRYCLAWANHSWWDMATGELLCEQRYLGADDYARYFAHCEPYLHSPNYIRFDGRPVFMVYRPHDVPDLAVFVETWRRRAERSGLPGVFLVGDNLKPADPLTALFDMHADSAGFWTPAKNWPWNTLRQHLRARLKVKLGRPDVYDYWAMVKDSVPADADERFAPTVTTGWDTSPRHGSRGRIFRDFTLAAFRRHLDDVSAFLVRRGAARNLVLVKSWNEWAEGNVIEPDDLFGEALLQAYGAFAEHTRAVLAAQVVDAR